MNIGTFIVLFILAVVVGAIVFRLVQNKKAGKHSCGGDCSSCHGCSHAIPSKK